MIRAFEFLARDWAGLRLVGANPFGELEWMGTAAQWQQVERLEAEILTAA